MGVSYSSKLSYGSGYGHICTCPTHYAIYIQIALIEAKDNIILQLLKETILKKVLIIDDSVQIHQAFKMMLNRFKCETITALNGQTGLQQLTRNPDVNLLIVDMNMPHMSGRNSSGESSNLGHSKMYR